MEEVKIVFEKKLLSPYQEEALAFLNDPEGRATRQALFQLVDNYVKDLAEEFFINEKLDVKKVLLKLQQLKIAVEKAKTLKQKEKNKNKISKAEQ